VLRKRGMRCLAGNKPDELVEFDGKDDCQIPGPSYGATGIAVCIKRLMGRSE
jgi:hypothetical protein